MNMRNSTGDTNETRKKTMYWYISHYEHYRHEYRQFIITTTSDNIPSYQEFLKKAEYLISDYQYFVGDNRRFVFTFDTVHKDVVMKNNESMRWLSNALAMMLLMSKRLFAFAQTIEIKNIYSSLVIDWFLPLL